MLFPWILGLWALSPLVQQTDLLASPPNHPAYRPGDVQGIAVDDAHTRAFVGQGAQIKILDLNNLIPGVPSSTSVEPYDHPAELETIPVDATVMKLAYTQASSLDPSDPKRELLLVAGGSFGLLAIDVRPGATPCPCSSGVACPRIVMTDDLERPVTPTSGENEKWCTDVIVVPIQGQDFIVALFSSFETTGSNPQQSELRVYRRSTLGLVRRVPIITSVTGARGYALSSNGSRVYMAMGLGGVFEIELFVPPTIPPLPPPPPPTAQLLFSVGTAPLADPHLIDPNTTVPTSILPGGWDSNYSPRIMDLEYFGGRLFVAADRWGLIVLDPILPNGANVKIHALPRVDPAYPTTLDTYLDTTAQINVAKARSHVLRVDVDTLAGETIVFARGGDPGILDDGTLPYNNYGRFKWDMSLHGDVTINDSALGCPSGLFVYTYQTSPSEGLARRSSTKMIAADILVDKVSSGDLMVYEQTLGANAPLSGFPWGLRAWSFAQNYPSFPALPAPVPVFPQPNSEPSIKFAYAGRASAPFCAFPSLRQPSLLIRGAEIAVGCAGESSQGLDVSTPDCPSLLGISLTSSWAGIFAPGAHWLDLLDNTAEWCVGIMGSNGFKLHRLRTTANCGLESWRIGLPEDPNYNLGRTTYLSSAMYSQSGEGEERLIVAYQGQYGACIYRRDRLLARTPFVCENEFLFTNPLTHDCPQPLSVTPDRCWHAARDNGEIYVAQLNTHPEGENPLPLAEDEKAFTFEPKILTVPLQVGGPTKSVAVIPCGFVSKNGAAYWKSPVIRIFDLDAPPVLVPSFVCSSDRIPYLNPVSEAIASPGSGSQFEGSAVALEIGTLCGRRLAFAADLGGRVLMFDITDLLNPTFVSWWDVPKSTLDNHYENVADILLDFGTGEAAKNYVYVAAARAGLIRLELTVDCGAEFPVTFPTSSWTDPKVKKRDTPGAALGLSLHEDGGLRGLILSDRHCGVRLYGDWNWGSTGTPLDCHNP